MTKNNIDNTAFYNLTYGLFLLSSKNSEKDNACIINTAVQIADNPKLIAFSVNKNNYTHSMISKNAQVNISSLTEKTPFDIFKRFGFQSGKDTDKFSDFHGAVRTDNGMYILSDYINAYFSLKVIKDIDCSSHTLFIADIEEAVKVSDEKSVTYSYYQSNIKPKNKESQKKGYVCTVCGYVYEGEPLPEDFICPWCKHDASYFKKL